MGAVDILSILNKRSEDIKEPQPLPVGTYLMMVDGLPVFPEDGIGKNNTPAAVVTCKYLAAQDDVSPGDVAEAGGLDGKTVRHTLWLTPDAQIMVVRFARDALGIKVENKSLREIFSEFPNKQFYAQIGHRPSADGSRLYNEIKSTSAA
jgi:hypothetical protein